MVQKFYYNTYILYSNIFLIDINDKKKHQILTLDDALILAKNMKLDLIQINKSCMPNIGELAVCILYDLKKYIYEQKKKKYEHNVSKRNIKEIKIKKFIDKNDLNRKINNIKNFLSKKNDVKITIQGFFKTIEENVIFVNNIKNIILNDINYIMTEKKWQSGFINSLYIQSK